MHPFVAPSPLRPNDRVHVIAPAGAVPQDAFEAGLALLEAHKLVPVYDRALLTRERYFAGSHARRQQELLAAITDPTTQAIWAARGGYGTARLLGPVHTEVVAAQRKWLVGFSDLTGLHAAYQRAGMVSVHGANITTLASWSPAARQDLFDLLTGCGPRAEQKTTRACWTHTFAGHAAQKPVGPDTNVVTGRLWGGNLTVLASLCGTGQLPKRRRQETSILLLEEIGEAPYRLDRCWHQLEASGVLDGVVGVAIGQLTSCEARGADYTGIEMLGDAIVAAGLPFVAGLPFGHADDAQAVPLGAVAHLDLDRQTLAVQL